MLTIDSLMRSTPVIPVLTIADVTAARPIAQALAAGGLTKIEVTLRTPAALEAIREIAQIDGIEVGAGTVTNERDLEAAVRAGARFAISPGLTDGLAKASRAIGIPLLPGIATASEILHGMDLGFDRFKFFPAEAMGGVKALKALAAPFSQCRFCPTGGVTQETAATWLALEAVLCVGGSWFLTDPFDAEQVRRRAKRAASLSDWRGHKR
jgi:2-dehydro-3-deoxyphosphogluconate aldolase/(4S)-4-hydroxy-2-oxoglutarate aldolase